MQFWSLATSATTPLLLTAATEVSLLCQLTVRSSRLPLAS